MMERLGESAKHGQEVLKFVCAQGHRIFLIHVREGVEDVLEGRSPRAPAGACPTAAGV